MAAVEPLGLNEPITRARIMLSTRNSDLTCAVGYRNQRYACFSCGSTAHMARECPKSTRRNAQTRSTRRCFVCDKASHIARNCPNRWQAGKRAGGNISTGCWWPGHVALAWTHGHCVCGFLMWRVQKPSNLRERNRKVRDRSALSFFYIGLWTMKLYQRIKSQLWYTLLFKL